MLQRLEDGGCYMSTVLRAFKLPAISLVAFEPDFSCINLDALGLKR